MNDLSNQAVTVGDLLIKGSYLGASCGTKIGKTLRIRLGAGPGGIVIGTSETTTGIKLPVQAVIYDAYVNVLVAMSSGTTKTLQCGLLATNTGGFLNGVNVATTGLSRWAITVSTSAGLDYTYMTASTLGGLLQIFNAGATSGNSGTFIPIAYNTDANSVVTVSVTPNSSDWGTGFSADLFLEYVDVLR